MEETKPWSWCHCSSTTDFFAARTFAGRLRNRDSVHFTMSHTNTPLLTLSKSHVSSYATVYYQTTSNIWTFVDDLKHKTSKLPWYEQRRENSRWTLYRDETYLCLKSCTIISKWKFHATVVSVPRFRPGSIHYERFLLQWSEENDLRFGKDKDLLSQTNRKVLMHFVNYKRAF